MKIPSEKVLMTVIIMFSFSTLFAQKQDYLIKTNGDTIHCKISTPFLHAGFGKYKANGMTESKTITTDEIKEFYFGKKDMLYRSVYVDSLREPKYLILIERGTITLYEYIQHMYSTSGGYDITSWYVCKGNDVARSLKTSEFFMSKSRQSRRDYLGSMLADKKDVYDKYIVDDKFTFKQIKAIIHWYNTGEPIQK
jgi:hypothetical protein